MESLKQEGISRQSSILKLPKQRQPLQCVVVNASSSENSPTFRIKRRVSFAKNRRIREFCNQSEQDTVWDNTYEEHDLSNTKNTSNANDHIMIIVPCHDKENFPVQLFLKNKKLLCSEDPISVSKEDDILQYDIEKYSMSNYVKKLDTDSFNTIEEIPNTTIYCDEGMDITTISSSNIISLPTQQLACFDDTVLTSENNIQNTTLNETKTIPIFFNRNLNQNKKNNTFELHYGNSSNKLTQAVPKLYTHKLPACSQMNLQNNQLELGQITQNKKGFSIREILNSLPVGVTEIMETSIPFQINSQEEKDEKTENFINTTVESAFDITHENICTCQFQNKSMNTSREIWQAFSTGNSISQISLAKKIEASNLLQERHKIFTDEPIGIIESLPKNLHISIEQLSENKTESFESKSIKKIQVPSIYIDTTQSTNINTDKTLHEDTQENTEIFVNKSLEMTEAVLINREIFRLNCPVSSQNENIGNVSSLPVDKSEKIHDDSCSNAIYIKESLVEETSNKTKIFLNESMELTEIYPIYSKGKVLENSVQNRLKIFQNKLMGVTESVPIYSITPQSTYINTDNILHEVTQENTEIFSSKSMEMTEAVLTNRQIFRLKCPASSQDENISILSSPSIDKSKKVQNDYSCSNDAYIKESLVEEIPNKTEIFSNKSMELSENYPVYSKRKLVQNSVKDRYKIFENNSMELTESVPIHIDTPQSTDISINKKLHYITQENTELFANKSMEMTEAVLNNRQIFQLNWPVSSTVPDENIIFLLSPSINKSKEVDINVNYFIATHVKKSLFEETPNETKIFSNKSMDFTEICPTNNKTKILQELVQNRTKIFENTSMEITEAVPICLKTSQSFDVNTDKMLHEIMQGNNETSANKSMELKDTLPNNRNCTETRNPNIIVLQELNKNKINNISDMSIELTKAMPSYNNDHNSISVSADKALHDIAEKITKNDINKSLEKAEVDSSIVQFSNSSKYKLSDNVKKNFGIFNITKELTESKSIPIYNENYLFSINRNKIQHKLLPKKCKKFYNKSTDTIKDSVKKSYKPLEMKTKYLTNKPSEVLKISHFTDSLSTKEESGYILNAEKPGKAVLYNVCLKVKDKKEHYNDSFKKTNESIDFVEQIFMPNKRFSDFKVRNEQTIPICKLNIPISSEMRQEGTKVSFDKAVDITDTIDACKNDSLSNVKQTKLGKKVNQSFENIIMDFTVNTSVKLSGTENYSWPYKDVKTNYSSLINSGYSQHNKANVNNGNIKDKDRLHISDKFINYNQVSKLSTNSYNTFMNFSAIPSTLFCNMKSSKIFNRCNNVNILSNNVNTIQDSVNSSVYYNKEKDYKISDSFTSREKSFHRMTSDELKTLYASMNLPTQKYILDESINAKNNYIPLYNDVNVLQDSLQKNIIIQQDSVANNFIKKNLEISYKMIQNIPNIDKMSNDQLSTLHININTVKVEKSPKRKATLLSKNVNSFDQNIKPIPNINLGSITNRLRLETATNLSNSKIQIYHNIPMETEIAPLSFTRQKFKETNKFIYTSNVTSNVTTEKTCMNVCEISQDKNDKIYRMNNLYRLLSGNTKILLENMYNSENPYLLDIDETTVKAVFNKSTINKTYINNSNSHEENNIKLNNIDNLDNNLKTDNQIQSQYLTDFKAQNKNERPVCGIEIPPFSENLEEILPPPFLCFDSIQENLIKSSFIKNSLNSFSDNLKKQVINNLPSIVKFQQNNRLSNENGKSTLEQTKKNEETLSLKKNNKETQKSVICNKNVNKNEDIVISYSVLTKSLKAYEKRDDCIWRVQTINTKFIAVNFITETFLVVISLNGMEKSYNKDIKNIELISCLRADTNNVLLKVVHKLLLLKLQPYKMLKNYKTFEHVVPMLKNISDEVIFAMNFMFDLTRINSLNLLNIDDKRISFIVASRKSNIILKVCLTIKIINEIGPNNIDVFCVLGDIRKNDIKHLITNIKRDHKFLSRYISDIKDYITLMEESIYLKKY